MTLLEIGIALAIAAGVMALAIPAVSNVARIQLRQKSGQLAGAVRSLYGSTAIGGHTCRLVLDLDANAYWSECAKTNVRLAREGEQSRSGARIPGADEALQTRATLSDEDRERLELARKSAFSASPDIPRTELGGSVKFTDVWVQHQTERYTTGQSFLYFWSSGLTEEASIHVAQGDDVYSLLVSPLTGRVRVVADRVDATGQTR